MAHVRKVGNAYQMQFYLNNRKRYKQFPPNTPKAVVKAEKKQIEANLALHKAGVRKFTEYDDSTDFMTLAELTEKVLKSKENGVAKETIDRNRYSMQLLMAVLGKDTLVSDLKPTHLDQFRNARFETAKAE